MNDSQVRLLSGALRFVLEFIFYTGLLATVSVPFIFSGVSIFGLPSGDYVINRYFFFFYNRYIDARLFTGIFLVVLGVSALIVTRQLILIFKSVCADQAFTRENTARLFRISYCCFAVSALLIIKTAMGPTALSYLMSAAFIIAGLAALVFSALFRLAVEYKSENDLTV